MVQSLMVISDPFGIVLNGDDENDSILAPAMVRLNTIGPKTFSDILRLPETPSIETSTFVEPKNSARRLKTYCHYVHVL